MQSNRPKLSFVPPLLPDQTLYSWVVVFHELSGNASINETRQQLCGTIGGGRHFHMPSHLDTLCASTQLAIGTPEDIVRTATILPYFTQFRLPKVVATTLRRARGESSYGVTQSLGMAATNSPHPPRRSCRECIQQDMESFGFSYWRRSHQLPGVLVCQQHRTRLLSLPYDHASISKMNILWPDNDWSSTNAADRWPNGPVTTLDTLHRLSILAVGMVTGELDGGYSVQSMKNACVLFLHERNLIARDGSLAIPMALSNYRSHFAEIMMIPEMAAATQGSIRPILSLWEHTRYRAHPRYRVHPLEWMLVIDWLFGNWQTFQECYQRAVSDK